MTAAITNSGVYGACGVLLAAALVTAAGVTRAGRRLADRLTAWMPMTEHCRDDAARLLEDQR